MMTAMRVSLHVQSTVRCGSDLGLFGFSRWLVSTAVKQLMVFTQHWMFYVSGMIKVHFYSQLILFAFGLLINDMLQCQYIIENL